VEREEDSWLACLIRHIYYIIDQKSKKQTLIESGRPATANRIDGSDQATLDVVLPCMRIENVKCLSITCPVLPQTQEDSLGQSSRLHDVLMSYPPYKPSSQREKGEVL
jgi:hypothetical protein